MKLEAYVEDSGLVDAQPVLGRSSMIENAGLQIWKIGSDDDGETQEPTKMRIHIFTP